MLKRIWRDWDPSKVNVGIADNLEVVAMRRKKECLFAISECVNFSIVFCAIGSIRDPV